MAKTTIIIDDYEGGVDVRLTCDADMDMTNAAEWTDGQRLAAEIYMQCGTPKRDVATEDPVGSDVDVDQMRGFNVALHEGFCPCPPGASPKHSKCICGAKDRSE
jgi:hypothetical protein